MERNGNADEVRSKSEYLSRISVTDTFHARAEGFNHIHITEYTHDFFITWRTDTAEELLFGHADRESSCGSYLDTVGENLELRRYFIGVVVVVYHSIDNNLTHSSFAPKRGINTTLVCYLAADVILHFQFVQNILCRLEERAMIPPSR